MTKIKLILLIFGEELDFTSITDIMKLTPTDFWKKGDKILGRKRELIRQESCWELNFEFVNTMFLDEVTDQIVSKLSNNLKEVEQYINDNKLQVKFNIVVETINKEKPSLYFNKSFLNIVTKMDAEIDIDLYNI